MCLHVQMLVTFHLDHQISALQFVNNRVYCITYLTNQVFGLLHLKFCFKLDERLTVTFISLVAKLLLGDALKEGTPISVNPLLLWAWAGLLINAINSIPAGELDGGRISFAIWGRKVCAIQSSLQVKLEA